MRNPIRHQQVYILQQQEIYNIADYLLVHNINSAEILKESYKVNGNKILFHPFPLIDISVLKEKSSERSSLTPTFLFIGVMRKEKGVQTLIDAWNRLGKNFNAKLIYFGSSYFLHIFFVFYSFVENLLQSSSVILPIDGNHPVHMSIHQALTNKAYAKIK